MRLRWIPVQGRLPSPEHSIRWSQSTRRMHGSPVAPVLIMAFCVREAPGPARPREAAETK
jgi:hypothetical protein